MAGASRILRRDRQSLAQDGEPPVRGCRRPGLPPPAERLELRRAEVESDVGRLREVEEREELGSAAGKRLDPTGERAENARPEPAARKDPPAPPERGRLLDQAGDRPPLAV